MKHFIELNGNLAADKIQPFIVCLFVGYYNIDTLGESTNTHTALITPITTKRDAIFNPLYLHTINPIVQLLLGFVVIKWETWGKKER